MSQVCWTFISINSSNQEEIEITKIYKRCYLKKLNICFIRKFGLSSCCITILIY